MSEGANFIQFKNQAYRVETQVPGLHNGSLVEALRLKGFLKSLSVTLTLPNIYGDVTWRRGRVTRLHQTEGQHPSTGSGQVPSASPVLSEVEGPGQCLVDLAVWCDNQQGEQTAQGRATVALPYRAATRR